MRQFAFLLFLILPIGLFAQTGSKARRVEKWFRNTGEIHFWFRCPDPAERKVLTRMVSFDHVRGDTVWAFANKKGMLQFVERFRGPIHRIPLPAEVYRKSQKKARVPAWDLQNFNTYPTYSQYEQQMQTWATQYPTLCRLVNLGTLPSGRKILALKISGNVDSTEAEPRFLYTSTMHGDETAGYPLMLKLIDDLLSGYNQNARLTRLVNGMEIWINPLANPDGTYRAGNNTVNGATRFNASNVDLNRNYPDPEDGLHPDGESYQPETRIFMKLADSLEFVMAANFHGGAEVANFPWDTWQIRHADEQWWVNECVKFADSARIQAPTGFFNQNFGYPFLPGVVQGFEWYEVNGGRQDYMNWFHNCRELTVELSNTKLLPQAQLEPHWNYFRRSLLTFMEASLYGISGRIRDLCTNQPIRARIRVLNHDKDSSHVYSRRSDGMYFRPIAPGSYTLEISAPGYQTRTVPGVMVVEGMANNQHFGLVPETPVPRFRFSRNDICSPTLRFEDLSGSASRWKWSFGTGDSAFSATPSYTYPGAGSYVVTLTSGNCTGEATTAFSQTVSISFVSPPTTRGDTSTCGARPHTLKAFSSQSIQWFSQPTGGNPVDTQSVFTTTPLNTSTTYYVQALQNLSLPRVGPQDNTLGGGGFFTGNAYHYQIFDVLRPLVLQSVRVFANTAGNRTIQLRNAQGQVQQSRVVNLPAGASRVLLNFSIPAGEGWQLGLNGGSSNNLFRNNSGAAYPYEIDGVVRITGNSAGDPGFYYFFYDWEIQSRCESPRVPVTARVENAPSPIVTVAPVPTVICSGDSLILSAGSEQSLNPAFAWFSGTQLLGTGNTHLVVAGTQSQTLRCRLTSADTCAVNNPVFSSPIVITGLPLPETPFIQLSGSGFLVSGSGPVRWYRDGLPLFAQALDSIQAPGSGTYTARKWSPEGCRSAPSTGIVISGTGIRQIPVPLVKREGNSLILNTAGSEAFQVLDGLGRVLFQQKSHNQYEKLELPGLPSGLYRIRFSPGGETSTFLW